MLHQKIMRGGGVIAKRADDLMVIVAIVGEAVRFDHRPVGQVAEHQIWRVLDAMGSLRAVAAAQRHVAAAGDRVTTDVRFHLDHDHRGTRFARHDRCWQPGGTGTHNHDVDFNLPSNIPNAGHDCDPDTYHAIWPERDGLHKIET